MNKNSSSLIDATSPDGRVARLAAGQLGVFSRRQALARGFAPHTVGYRLRSRRWEQVRAGVYRISGTPDSWKQAVMAACLWAGDGAVASHVTAARLWELEGLPGKPRAETIHLSVPPPRHPSEPDVSVHRPRKLETKDCAIRDGIPVTDLSRTLIDLAAEPEAVKLELLLASALGKHRQFDLAGLKKTLRRLNPRGREGVSALKELMSTRGGAPKDR
jgi:predicted transcriptional regulator of viral defense system